MENFKKLASKLLIYQSVSEMRDVMNDYVEFSREDDFELNTRDTLSSLNVKAYKYPIFIVLASFVILYPHILMYFSPFLDVQVHLFGTIISVILTMLCPIIIMKLYGRKLVIIDNFHQKSASFSILTTIMYVFINAFALFIVSGYFVKCFVSVTTINIDYANVIWTFFEIFLRLFLVLVIFLAIKLFSCGISYFMPLFSAYFGLAFFRLFYHICCSLSDMSTLNPRIYIAFAIYIVSMVISVLLYLIINKKRGEKYESSI
ncbi:MAG: hypothetical protein R3Y12_03495 [Clostridia bacterium]